MLIVYTEKFKKFDSLKVGQTDEQPQSIADTLIRKGYAVEKGKELESKGVVAAEVVVEVQSEVVESKATTVEKVEKPKKAKTKAVVKTKSRTKKSK